MPELKLEIKKTLENDVDFYISDSKYLCIESYLDDYQESIITIISPKQANLLKDYLNSIDFDALNNE